MLHSNVCQPMTKWYSPMWYPPYWSILSRERPLVKINLKTYLTRHMIEHLLTTWNQQYFDYLSYYLVLSNLHFWSCILVWLPTLLDHLGSSSSTNHRYFSNRCRNNYSVHFVPDESFQTDLFNSFSDWLRLGWCTAYLANLFLAKLQGPILPRQSRDRTNPNHKFLS